ncbi:MAG: nucleoid-associated protein [Rikenellaceae bacterium]|nr:nucleoid-associated protein [Rikenellaceae bacterium]
MISFQDSKIENIIIHRVNNKLTDGQLILSKDPLNLDSEVLSLLLHFFTTPFLKINEVYNFYHQSDLSFNEVFNYSSNIFEDKNLFFKESLNLAKHLFENSTHQNIKDGDFYVVLFDKCEINGQTAQAIGLFKSENTETFLKVYQSGNAYTVEGENGININKLDKGAIIVNLEKDNGYLVSIIDKNKGDTQYWLDGFLHIKQCENNYFQTDKALAVFKDFITKELPKNFEIDKADQAEFLNKSVSYFKEKEEFNSQDFKETVFQQPEIIEDYSRFKAKYENENNIEISDSFEISNQALKKQERRFKSVIKLDRNFHIYIHGDRQRIKKGFDENMDMSFYQIYFKEES